VVEEQADRCEHRCQPEIVAPASMAAAVAAAGPTSLRPVVLRKSAGSPARVNT